MSRKSGLGKGLDALIPSGEEFDDLGRGVLQVLIGDIQPNPRQPRSDIDEESLLGLSDSIQQHGILQPLIVVKADDGDGYVLVAGERRLRAARLAGLSSVPVIIRHADQRQRLEWALLENLQRSDLNPLEAADGYRQLAEDFGLSHDQIAEQVAKSRTAVTNTLRLLKLSPAVQQALLEGKIHEGHARALLGLRNSQAQSAALQTIIQRDLNVRQTEELVRKLKGKSGPANQSRKRSPEVTALEDQLREELGTRVRLKLGRKGGSIVLYFYSDEELNALVERLLDRLSES